MKNFSKFSSGAFTVSFLITTLMCIQSCHNSQSLHSSSPDTYQLIVLDPGHFHAALLQKTMYKDIDSTVKVFAPGGPELNTYLDLIKEYNNRPDSPTHWTENVYTGANYIQQMLQQEDGKNAIVVIAGNNEKKTDYITESIEAGLNVLADKPMAISSTGFEQLRKAFDTADGKRVLLYDIMTERYAITNILQKMFLHMPGVFGQLEKGTAQTPAIVSKSVHYFYKQVSGKPALRPTWYFDVNQQGDGIVDITSHLIDLIQWECFPRTIFDYKTDVQMLSATRWATRLSLDQFSKVTGVDTFPSFLQKYLKNNELFVFANGDMHYTLKGVNIEVGVEWRYEASEGSGDTFYSLIRGTKASLLIKQDKEQDYKPTLYIMPVNAKDETWKASLKSGLEEIHKTYPGVSLSEQGDSFRVIIPDRFKTGHEQQFAGVVNRYLEYLKADSMPQWEKSFMLTKYYTTTQALKTAEK